VAYDLGNLPEAFSFYSDGVYTLETNDPEVLAHHLGQRAEVWAVMNRPGLDRLPEAVRRRLEIAGETHLNSRDVLLVNNGGPGG
jgi:hypothetical protein